MTMPWTIPMSIAIATATMAANSVTRPPYRMASFVRPIPLKSWAATGASGALYAGRLLRALLCGGHQVHAVLSRYGSEIASEGTTNRGVAPYGAKLVGRYGFSEGLLKGLDLHREVAGDMVVAGLAQGVLLNPVRPDVVRMMPPLTITEDEVDRGVELLELAIRDVLSR